MHCGVCGSISGFAPLDAGSTPSPPKLCETEMSADNAKTLWGAKSPLVENHCSRGSAQSWQNYLLCTLLHIFWLFRFPFFLPLTLYPVIIQGLGCLLSVILLSFSVHQTFILPFTSSETHSFPLETQFKLFEDSSCSPGPSDLKPLGIFLTS